MIPEAIQQSMNYTAYEMLADLYNNRLQVVLVDAPEQRFVGHMIRVAVEHNVWWWKQLYAEYKPKKLDKKNFCLHLMRFMRNLQSIK